MGAEKVWLEKDTTHLPYGYFWCEWFEGRHLSIDYKNKKQVLCVEGHKQKDTFTKWDKWIKTNDELPFPNILKDLTDIELINCEYIGDKLIEVHLRHNEDFSDNIAEFIPVWKGQDTTPQGYTYRDYPDVHGRIGAFVK